MYLLGYEGHETILVSAQKAPEYIQWTIGKQEFDEMIATKKNSSLGHDGIPCCIYRCAGGLTVRQLDALRPLTLCNRCIHPAQRCVSTRQMTDNTFEVETTAVAHVACATRDSGILLTHFACAYRMLAHVPNCSNV